MSKVAKVEVHVCAYKYGAKLSSETRPYTGVVKNAYVRSFASNNYNNKNLRLHGIRRNCLLGCYHIFQLNRHFTLTLLVITFKFVIRGHQLLEKLLPPLTESCTRELAAKDAIDLPS
jgi:hypothetical protein